MSIPSVNDSVRRTITKGLWRKVRKGNSTLFWEHVQIGQTTLKEKFPRLYNLSMQKDYVVMDMGYWDGLVWRWTLIWRRDFFQWEIPLFEDLQHILQQPVLNSLENDSVLWRFNPLGQFSTKTFCNHVTNLVGMNSIGDISARLAWKGLAPPRAKLLVWFVLQGKLNIRARLVNPNILPPVAAVCPFLL